MMESTSWISFSIPSSSGRSYGNFSLVLVDILLEVVLCFTSRRPRNAADINQTIVSPQNNLRFKANFMLSRKDFFLASLVRLFTFAFLFFVRVDRDDFLAGDLAILLGWVAQVL